MTNQPYTHHLAEMTTEELYRENNRVNNRMMQSTNRSTTSYYRKLRTLTEREITNRHSR